jgi:hypothetical protein
MRTASSASSTLSRLEGRRTLQGLLRIRLRLMVGMAITVLESRTEEARN